MLLRICIKVSCHNSRYIYKYVCFFCLLAFMFASVKSINLISLLFYWYCAVLSLDKIYLIFVVPGESPNKPSGFEFRTVDASFWDVVLAGWRQECASFAVWEVECWKRHEMSFLLPFYWQNSHKHLFHTFLEFFRGTYKPQLTHTPTAFQTKDTFT